MTITAFRSLLILLSLCLPATLTAYAQTSGQAELNLTLGEQRVRFAPTRSFQEMRLEVVNSVGEVVFTHMTTEAEFDWNLRVGNGEALAPGLYRYALTLKFSEELSRQHTGHFIVEKGQDQIWLTASDGAEVSGTALSAARSGGRSIAGLGSKDDKSVKRDVSGREIVDEKGNKLPKDKDKSARQEKAALTGTANMVAKFDATGLAANVIDSAITETGGNVGIGTTSPNAKLSVTANVGMPPTEVGIVGYFANANESNTFITADSYGNGPWHSDFLFRRARGTMAAPSAVATDDIIGQIQARGYGVTSFAATSRAGIRLTAAENWSDAAQGAYLAFLTTPRLSNAINTERMRITDAGNVGIGTTSPDIKLEVVGNSSTGTIYTTTFGSDNAVIGRSAGGTANAPAATPAGRSLMLLGGRGHNGTGFTLNRATINLEASEAFTNTAAGTRITFSTTSNGNIVTSERMRIDHNGNVGIGTTTPGSRLEVAGAIGADFQYNLNGNRILHATGTTNLFAGVNAGLGITTGFSNAFFGYEAGRLTSTGDRNSFFGRSAGENNSSGNQNSFFGHSAGLANIQGSDNAFFGYLAGTANVGGHSNSFYGRSAGAANTEGTFNTFVGIYAGQANMGGGANTFVGSSAGFNSTGQNNSFFGTNAGAANTGGDRNTVIGSGANVASGNLSYATALGASAVVSNSNSVVLGRSEDTVRVPGDLSITGDIVGSVSVIGSFAVTDDLFGEAIYANTTLNAGSLDASSGHVCHDNTTLTDCFSTRRMKDQILSFHKGLSLLERLRPVTFNWKKSSQPDIGLIAEEVAEVEPRLASHNTKTGEIIGVKYDQITAVLINAVKEQQAQLAVQQRQLASLKKQVSRIQRKAAARSTIKRTK